MAEQAVYELFVDWDNDGDFEDAGENVSDDWMRAGIHRGFSGAMSRLPGVGRGTFVLKNTDRQYSPELNADVVPRRAVKFDMTYGDSTETLFFGYLETIEPASGSYESRSVVFECVDGMALLDLYEGEVALAVNQYADDIIDDIVSSVYDPPDTSYQAGVNIFPVSSDQWSYQESGKPVEEIKATDKISDVCVADWGVFFIAKDGDAVFYNRHQMPLDASTKLTINGTMQSLNYKMAVSSVYNHVEVTCYPRSVGNTLEVVGRISQDKAIVVDAGATIVLSIPFRDSVNSRVTVGGMGCVVPVAGTDFDTTNDPEGQGDNTNASVNASADFYGDHAEISLENTSADPIYLQRLQVRGYGVRVREKVTVISEDATSVAAYQRRKMRVNAALMSNPAEAQALADYLLGLFKDPYGVITGIGFVANVSSTRMEAARDLELCDLVELTETQTGLSSYKGHIMSIDHAIDPVLHRVTFSLATHYDIGTPFRLDVSQFDSGHYLIY